MHYVYIIKSKKTSGIYIGCTNDLRKRFDEHNKNKVRSTRYKGPWEIRYYEAFFSKYDAFQRESKIKKNARGLQELKKRLKNSLQ